MSTNGDSQRRCSELSEQERLVIARQVAEAMDIRRTMGADTRISGCQGCGQCLSGSTVGSAVSAPGAGPAEFGEADLVRLIQDVVREVVQEYRDRSGR